MHKIPSDKIIQVKKIVTLNNLQVYVFLSFTVILVLIGSLQT